MVAVSGAEDEIKFFPAFTDPALQAGGVAVDQGIVRYIAADDGPGAYKCVAADGNPADDGGIGTDGGAFFDPGRFELFFALDEGAGVYHVGEDHGGSQKHFIFTGYAGVNGDVVLDFDSVAQNHTGGNDYILADVAAFPDFTAAHNVAEVPDLRTRANLNVLINV